MRFSLCFFYIFFTIFLVSFRNKFPYFFPPFSTCFSTAEYCVKITAFFHVPNDNTRVQARSFNVVHSVKYIMHPVLFRMPEILYRFYTVFIPAAGGGSRENYLSTLSGFCVVPAVYNRHIRYFPEW